MTTAYVALLILLCGVLQSVFTYTKPRTLLRIRREEENPNAFYMPCCKIKMNVSVENDITRQCQQDLDDKYGLKLPVYKVSDRTEQQEEKYDNAFYEQESLVFRNRSACYAQCILQKHNAADADGNVIPEKAVEFLKSIIPLTNDDFWGAVNDVCVSVSDDRPFLCKANSMLFKDCAHYMSDVYCPKDLQRKTTTCDDYRVDLKRRFNIKN